MTNRVVIVGGGLAGLAAAEALSARGLPVTLLESRPRLGGRASSFEDKATGDLIDNCQHVGMGCCTNFSHFCKTTGIAHAFRTERELTFIGADGTQNRFAAGRLPAPLHLLSAFGRLSYLDRDDRGALSLGLRRLAKAKPASLEDISFADWLAKHGQTPNAIRRFWHVVVVSALSESLDRVSAAHARKVFVDAFLSNPDGWTVQIPTAPLSELYGSTLSKHLAKQGVQIRTGAGVKQLHFQGDRISGVELRSGEVIDGDEFILAVPQHLVRALLPAPQCDDPALVAAESLETAPISSVHLWFDRPITDLPHAVLVDRLGQWMFNRTVLHQASGGHKPPESPLDTESSPNAESSPDPLYYYQIVISASRDLEGKPSAETIEEVRAELADIFPAARDATLVHSRLVTEHRAVFSVRPGSDQLRPPQQSAVPNLQLAGDWTRTGWPATMEGAVRSGYLAAENVLRHADRPEPLLQADLPAGRMARWLLRLPRPGKRKKIGKSKAVSDAQPAPEPAAVAADAVSVTPQRG